MPATTNVDASQSDLKQIERLALEARLVRELDGGRAALPILPHVAAQAIRFANNPNSDLRKLAELVEADPPIAARLLAVANSAIYTRTVRVSTSRAAIIRLGLEGTRDLLFQVVYASSTVGLPRYQDLVARSFRRSVLCGIAARIVSEEMRFRFEYDYLCGLLHDIGEARIYRILANYKEAIDPNVIEDLVVRYHRRAGAELAIAWGLPEPIIETCAHHHDAPEKASRLVKMVMMADILVTILERRQAALPAPVGESSPAAGASDASLARTTSPAPYHAASAAIPHDAPAPTDPDAALGPSSAIWPISFTDPPGAPDPAIVTWAKGEAPAKELASPSAASPVAATAPAGETAEASAQPTLDDDDAVDHDVDDFARLATLGLARELAETILIKLGGSIVDLPI